MVQINEVERAKADRERDQTRQGATSLEKTMPGHPDYRNPLHRGPGDVNDTHSVGSGPKGEGPVDASGKPLRHTSADPQAIDKNQNRVEPVVHNANINDTRDARNPMMGERGPTNMSPGERGPQTAPKQVNPAPKPDTHKG